VPANEIKNNRKIRGGFKFGDSDDQSSPFLLTIVKPMFLRKLDLTHTLSVEAVVTPFSKILDLLLRIYILEGKLKV